MLASPEATDTVVRRRVEIVGRFQWREMSNKVSAVCNVL